MTKIKLFLLVMGVAFVFLLSEVMFTYNNQDRLSLYAFEASKILSSRGNIEGAFWILQKAAIIVIEHNNKLYPSATSPEPPQIEVSSDLQFKNTVSYGLASITKEDFLSSQYDLGLVFYNFGIEANNNNKRELIPLFFTMAAELNPTLSFWSVELANYYMSNGQSEMARRVLVDCMRLDAPRKHCQSFLDENVNFNNIQKIGFLEEGIMSYFRSSPH